MDYKNQIAYAFPRGEGEQVQLSIREFENRHYLDVRIWFLPKNEQEYKPTKKGLLLDLKQINNLNKGVQELSKAVYQFQKSK